MHPVYLTECMGLGRHREVCFVSRVCRVKHTDHKVRFWSFRLRGTFGPFWGDLVVTLGS